MLAPVVAMVLCAACSLPLGVGRSRARVQPRPRPVALIAEGSAFQRAGAREAAAAALARVIRRRVVVVAAPSPADDPQMKRLATRFAKETPRLASYDWREPHCAADSVVVTGVEQNVGTVYRVSLTRTERWRPASDAEMRAEPVHHVASRALAALRLARTGAALEESISGTVVMSTFTGSGGRRVGVARAATLVEPSRLTRRLGVAAAVRDAVKGLPPPRDPRWDGVAHRLIASGCPFLALAVSDLRPGLASGRHGTRTAVLAAIHQQLEQRAAAELASATSREFDTALHEGRLDTAASILTRYAALPDSRRETVSELAAALEAARRGGSTRGRDEGPSSCSALCALHMVDICNRDRALWESHRRPWEQTACGTRRPEAFLKECYQRQWLTGAFHEGCIVPCERTPEGRQRLIAILRDAGCRIRLS